MVAALTATLQSGVYPPRVALAVTGLSSNSIIISRVVAGEYQQIRDAFLPSYTGSTFVAVDAELPFGVPVTYSLWVDGTEGVDTEGPTTYTLPGGKMAISDAITGLSVEVERLAQGPITRARQATTYRVGGKNFVVSGPLGQGERDDEFFLETAEANEQLTEVLENATQGIVQIRRYVSHPDADGYFAVTSAEKDRHSADGTDERRTWVLHLVETDTWDFNTQHTATYTYADLTAYYAPSGTYANLLADKASYLAVLTGDWS